MSYEYETPKKGTGERRAGFQLGTCSFQLATDGRAGRFLHVWCAPASTAQVRPRVPAGRDYFRRRQIQSVNLLISTLHGWDSKFQNSNTPT